MAGVGKAGTSAHGGHARAAEAGHTRVEHVTDASAEGAMDDDTARDVSRLLLFGEANESLDNILRGDLPFTGRRLSTRSIGSDSVPFVDHISDSVPSGRPSRPGTAQGSRADPARCVHAASVDTRSLAASEELLSSAGSAVGHVMNEEITHLQNRALADYCSVALPCGADAETTPLGDGAASRSLASPAAPIQAPPHRPLHGERKRPSFKGRVLRPGVAAHETPTVASQVGPSQAPPYDQRESLGKRSALSDDAAPLVSDDLGITAFAADDRQSMATVSVVSAGTNLSSTAAAAAQDLLQQWRQPDTSHNAALESPTNSSWCIEQRSVHDATESCAAVRAASFADVTGTPGRMHASKASSADQVFAAAQDAAWSARALDVIGVSETSEHRDSVASAGLWSCCRTEDAFAVAMEAAQNLACDEACTSEVTASVCSCPICHADVDSVDAAALLVGCKTQLGQVSTMLASEDQISVVSAGSRAASETCVNLAATLQDKVPAVVGNVCASELGASGYSRPASACGEGVFEAMASAALGGAEAAHGSGRFPSHDQISVVSVGTSSCTRALDTHGPSHALSASIVRDHLSLGVNETCASEFDASASSCHMLGSAASDVRAVAAEAAHAAQREALDDRISVESSCTAHGLRAFGLGEQVEPGIGDTRASEPEVSSMASEDIADHQVAFLAAGWVAANHEEQVRTSRRMLTEERLSVASVGTGSRSGYKRASSGVQDIAQEIVTEASRKPTQLSSLFRSDDLASLVSQGSNVKDSGGKPVAVKAMQDVKEHLLSSDTERGASLNSMDPNPKFAALLSTARSAPKSAAFDWQNLSGDIVCIIDAEFMLEGMDAGALRNAVQFANALADEVRVSLSIWADVPVACCDVQLETAGSRGTYARALVVCPRVWVPDVDALKLRLENDSPSFLARVTERTAKLAHTVVGGGGLAARDQTRYFANVVARDLRTEVIPAPAATGSSWQRGGDDVTPEDLPAKAAAASGESFPQKQLPDTDCGEGTSCSQEAATYAQEVAAAVGPQRDGEDREVHCEHVPTSMSPFSCEVAPAPAAQDTGDAKGEPGTASSELGATDGQLASLEFDLSRGIPPSLFNNSSEAFGPISEPAPPDSQRQEQAGSPEVSAMLGVASTAGPVDPPSSTERSTAASIDVDDNSGASSAALVDCLLVGTLVAATDGEFRDTGVADIASDPSPHQAPTPAQDNSTEIAPGRCGSVASEAVGIAAGVVGEVTDFAISRERGSKSVATVIDASEQSRCGSCDVFASAGISPATILAQVRVSANSSVISIDASGNSGETYEARTDRSVAGDPTLARVAECTSERACRNAAHGLDCASVASSSASMAGIAAAVAGEVNNSVLAIPYGPKSATAVVASSQHSVADNPVAQALTDLGSFSREQLGRTAAGTMTPMAVAESCRNSRDGGVEELVVNGAAVAAREPMDRRATMSSIVSVETIDKGGPKSSTGIDRIVLHTVAAATDAATRENAIARCVSDSVPESRALSLGGESGVTVTIGQNTPAVSSAVSDLDVAAGIVANSKDFVLAGLQGTMTPTAVADSCQDSRDGGLEVLAVRGVAAATREPIDRRATTSSIVSVAAIDKGPRYSPGIDRVVLHTVAAATDAATRDTQAANCAANSVPESLACSLGGGSGIPITVGHNTSAVSSAASDLDVAAGIVANSKDFVLAGLQGADAGLQPPPLSMDTPSAVESENSDVGVIIGGIMGVAAHTFGDDISLASVDQPSVVSVQILTRPSSAQDALYAAASNRDEAMRVVPTVEHVDETTPATGVDVRSASQPVFDAVGAPARTLGSSLGIEVQAARPPSDACADDHSPDGEAVDGRNKCEIIVTGLLEEPADATDFGNVSAPSLCAQAARDPGDENMQAPGSPDPVVGVREVFDLNDATLGSTAQTNAQPIPRRENLSAREEPCHAASQSIVDCTPVVTDQPVEPRVDRQEVDAGRAADGSSSNAQSDQPTAKMAAPSFIPHILSDVPADLTHSTAPVAAEGSTGWRTSAPATCLSGMETAAGPDTVLEDVGGNSGKIPCCGTVLPDEVHFVPEEAEVCLGTVLTNAVAEVSRDHGGNADSEVGELDSNYSSTIGCGQAAGELVAFGAGYVETGSVVAESDSNSASATTQVVCRAVEDAILWNEAPSATDSFVVNSESNGAITKDMLRTGEAVSQKALFEEEAPASASPAPVTSYRLPIEAAGPIAVIAESAEVTTEEVEHPDKLVGIQRMIVPAIESAMESHDAQAEPKASIGASNAEPDASAQLAPGVRDLPSSAFVFDPSPKLATSTLEEAAAAIEDGNSCDPPENAQRDADASGSRAASRESAGGRLEPKLGAEYVDERKEGTVFVPSVELPTPAPPLLAAPPDEPSPVQTPQGATGMASAKEQASSQEACEQFAERPAQPPVQLPYAPPSLTTIPAEQRSLSAEHVESSPQIDDIPSSGMDPPSATTVPLPDSDPSRASAMADPQGTLPSASDEVAQSDIPHEAADGLAVAVAAAESAPQEQISTPSEKPTASVSPEKPIAAVEAKAASEVGTAVADAIDANASENIDDLAGPESTHGPVVVIDFAFRRLDYDKITASPSMSRLLSELLKEGVALLAQIPDHDVSLALERGSVIVKAVMWSTPSGLSVEDLAACLRSSEAFFLRSMVQRVLKVPGILSATEECSVDLGVECFNVSVEPATSFEKMRPVATSPAQDPALELQRAAPHASYIGPVRAMEDTALKSEALRPIGFLNDEFLVGSSIASPPPKPVARQFLTGFGSERLLDAPTSLSHGSGERPPRAIEQSLGLPVYALSYPTVPKTARCMELHRFEPCLIVDGKPFASHIANVPKRFRCRAGHEAEHSFRIDEESGVIEAMYDKDGHKYEYEVSVTIGEGERAVTAKCVVGLTAFTPPSGLSYPSIRRTFYLSIAKEAEDETNGLRPRTASMIKQPVLFHAEPQIKEGEVNRFEIYPDLPKGMTFDAASGTVKGLPEHKFPSVYRQSFEIFAYNDVGLTACKVALQIVGGSSNLCIVTFVTVDPPHRDGIGIDCETSAACLDAVEDLQELLAANLGDDHFANRSFAEGFNQIPGRGSPVSPTEIIRAPQAVNKKLQGWQYDWRGAVERCAVMVEKFGQLMPIPQQENMSGLKVVRGMTAGAVIRSFGLCEDNFHARRLLRLVQHCGSSNHRLQVRGFEVAVAPAHSTTSAWDTVIYLRAVAPEFDSGLVQAAKPSSAASPPSRSRTVDASRVSGRRDVAASRMRHLMGVLPVEDSAQPSSLQSRSDARHAQRREAPRPSSLHALPLCAKPKPDLAIPRGTLARGLLAEEHIPVLVPHAASKHNPDEFSSVLSKWRLKGKEDNAHEARLSTLRKWRFPV